jgi:hypothetical protein
MLNDMRLFDIREATHEKEESFNDVVLHCCCPAQTWVEKSNIPQNVEGRVEGIVDHIDPMSHPAPSGNRQAFLIFLVALGWIGIDAVVLSF